MSEDALWNKLEEIYSKEYKCGYCNNYVGNNKGYRDLSNKGYIYICPRCKKPTFFDKDNNQYPGVLQGNAVLNIDDKNVEDLYNEARRCFSVNSFTSVALCCRKLIMNVSVHLGADENKNFQYYVNWLDEKHYITPNSKLWVDQIRKIGNVATHEIQIVSEDDAKKSLHFIEMLLKIVYEFPAMVK